MKTKFYWGETGSGKLNTENQVSLDNAIKKESERKEFYSAGNNIKRGYNSYKDSLKEYNERRKTRAEAYRKKHRYRRH